MSGWHKLRQVVVAYLDNVVIVQLGTIAVVSDLG